MAQDDFGEFALTDASAIYFYIIAGGVRAKLLESVVNSKILDLFFRKSIVSESYIIQSLKLNPLRAKKWLHLLTLQGYLEKKEIQNEPHFLMGRISKLLYNNDQNVWWCCNQMVHTWERVSKESLIDVLKGNATSNSPIPWPPKTVEHAASFEQWIAKTSQPPIIALLSLLDFSRIKNLLDVGGGDGTIGCALAQQHPKLNVTIYNLPLSIPLIEDNIKIAELEKHVSAYAGDFKKETSFPEGFDFILFCRVLWDWSESTNLKLLQMAYNALPSGGRVAICEIFRENSKEFSLSWEYCYLFWDEYEIAVFKTSDTYIKLLKEVGFQNITFLKDEEKTPFTILMADKP